MCKYTSWAEHQEWTLNPETSETGNIKKEIVNTKKVSSESLKATLESGGFKIIKIHPTTKVDPSAQIDLSQIFTSSQIITPAQI